LNTTTTFALSISGLKSDADAEGIVLETGALRGLAFAVAERSAGETRSFEVRVEYDGITAFPEGFASIALSLSHVPQGYSGGKHNLQLAVRDGLARERAIPLSQAEFPAFQDYARAAGLGRHYRLSEDVRLPEVEAPWDESNWTPIGTEAAGFSGSFDGDGHTLSGLSIYSSYENYQGLFGYIGAGGVVENLVLENDYVINWRSYTGGIAGWNDGVIRNCHVRGGHIASGLWVGGIAGVNEGAIEDCSNTGVIGNSMYAGGVAGYSSGVVQGSYATGNVAGDGGVLGGVVGHNVGTVRHCHATGTVAAGSGDVGGVAGRNEGRLENCYATGRVSGGGNAFGGVVGYNVGGTVANCYATGEVSGGMYVGGVVGFGGVAENVYATGEVSGGSMTGGVMGGEGRLRNAYATGRVYAYTAAGGIMGRGGEAENCVALNAQVSQGEVLISGMLGRIIGSYSPAMVFSNNHAREDMDIRYDTRNPAGGTAKATLSDAAGPDGGDISIAELNLAFWEGLSWDFEGIWEEGEGGGLPRLRGPGGPQAPTLP